MKFMKFLFWSAILLNCFNMRADSPLTSTDIYKAYLNNPMVKKTPLMGILNLELMAYLSDPVAPLEVKVAVINKLGWDTNGKKNAALFFNYLKVQQGYQTEFDFTNNGSSADLICYAYLKAMDDYFDVKQALIIATKASEKEPNSFSVNFITQLIQAQDIFLKDGCKAYQALAKVSNNKELLLDMKQEAIEIVFEYMNLYKKYCK